MHRKENNRNIKNILLGVHIVIMLISLKEA